MKIIIKTKHIGAYIEICGTHINRVYDGRGGLHDTTVHRLVFIPFILKNILKKKNESRHTRNPNSLNTMPLIKWHTVKNTLESK